MMAQDQPKPDKASVKTDKTEVKINYLNVCTPTDEEKKELGGALSRIPQQAKFTTDFEISRGRSTMNQPPAALAAGDPSGVVADNGGVSSWVRVRREFPTASPFLSVQYS